MASKKPHSPRKTTKPKPGQSAKNRDVSTDEILSQQYDMRQNDMVKRLMQADAGAYHSVTGNLNFR
ncbi:MAG TPA: hypothetical protein DHW71_02630 [Gammaproteobacteria bacterium]|nr:hypothetical protein [Gammaproteobacteria bacterium]MEC8012101.1 hypothetical protein [Pseudomonadota bacterium]HBF08046.1 hypothetical protein [Gammaproteobacteria bacterium]HCK91851.1 hypothetical protein [Gammaproteobacteria bacterium]|tara:strand:- start:585 stop:782 length:198 start_codon:yes stop_codon:yes gene_type:complete